MKKIKITLLIMMLLCVKLVHSQCASFEFRSVNSGNDFLDLDKYSDIEICESSGSIQFGSHTFYIVGKGYRNGYGQGDFIYDIQEARGYWPKIGFVKVAKDFSLIQLKFMNSVVVYDVNIKKKNR